MNYKIYELSLKNFSIEIYKHTDIIKALIFCKSDGQYNNINYDIYFETNRFYTNYKENPSFTINNFILLFTKAKFEIYSGDSLCTTEKLEEVLKLFDCKEELKLLDEEHKISYIYDINKKIEALKNEIIDLENQIIIYEELNEPI